jgi:hypothetical protein
VRRVLQWVCGEFRITPMPAHFEVSHGPSHGVVTGGGGGGSGGSAAAYGGVRCVGDPQNATLGENEARDLLCPGTKLGCAAWRALTARVAQCPLVVRNYLDRIAIATQVRMLVAACFCPCCAQMSSFVGIGEVRSSGTEDVLLSLLRMQAPSHSSTGFCILHGLTATSKVALDVGLQLGVGVAMVALVLLGRVLTKVRWPTRGPRAPTTSFVRPGRPCGLQPRDPELTVAMEGAYTTLLDAASAPRASSAFGLESGPAESTPVPDPLSLRARYIAAAVNFGLTMYANVTLGVIKMMHCVWVPGTPRHTRHLFIRATQQCDYSGWQLPYAAVLVGLVLAPVALVIAALWSRGRLPEHLVTLEQGQPSRLSALASDFRLGLRRAAVDCYVQQRPWWEAVLVLQRLVSAWLCASCHVQACDHCPLFLSVAGDCCRVRLRLVIPRAPDAATDGTVHFVPRNPSGRATAAEP